MGKVDQRRVRRFVAELLGAGVSPARVRKAVGTLRQVLELAVEGGLIRDNPCEGLKLPRMNQQEMHFLTAEQVATLAAATSEPYGSLVTFAAYTGLRAGEIAALRARHIDLDTGRVMVVTAVSEVRGTLVEQEPKSPVVEPRGALVLPTLSACRPQRLPAMVPRIRARCV